MDFAFLSLPQFVPLVKKFERAQAINLALMSFPPAVYYFPSGGSKVFLSTLSCKSLIRVFLM
jgi:hypothetical protein